MLATRCNTVSGRVTALWSETATFGFGWIPAKGADHFYEQALCAWWNSTPGRILLLNRRSKELTYPKWSIKHLKAVPCPKPDNPALVSLQAAFERVCEMELLPMRQAEECEARKVIDEAAAVALGVAPEVIEDWRRRLAMEPTITNARAID